MLVVDNPDVQSLAADPWNHDGITVAYMKRKLRDFDTCGAVKAPKMTIIFRVSLVKKSLLSYAGRFGKILSLVTGGRSGQPIIMYEHHAESHNSGGVQVLNSGLGYIRFSTGPSS